MYKGIPDEYDYDFTPFWCVVLVEVENNSSSLSKWTNSRKQPLNSRACLLRTVLAGLRSLSSRLTKAEPINDFSPDLDNGGAIKGDDSDGRINWTTKQVFATLWAFAESLKYVWYTSIAFGGLSIVACIFLGDISKYMTNRIAANIRR